MTDVDVEQLGAALNLHQRLIEDVVDIVVNKRLLEDFLTRGVDAFSDDARSVDLDNGIGAAYGGARGSRAGDICFVRKNAPNLSDIIRCCAAAAADELHPVGQQRGNALRELSGKDIVFIGIRVGKSRVRLDDQGQVGIARHLRDDRLQLVGTERAVDADSVNTQTAQRQRGGGRRYARKGSAVALKGHGGENRQLGVLLCRENSRFQLKEVGHGLKDDQIRLSARENLLLEVIIRLLKPQRAGRLEQHADGTDIKRDERIGTLSGFFCIADGGGDDLLYRTAAFRELIGVRAEGVGIDNIRTRLDIRAMEGFDQLGSGEVERFGRMLISRAALLNQRAHRSVEDDKFFVIQQCFQIHSAFPFFCRRRFRAGCKWRSRVSRAESVGRTVR